MLYLKNILLLWYMGYLIYDILVVVKFINFIIILRVCKIILDYVLRLYLNEEKKSMNLIFLYM